MKIRFNDVTIEGDGFDKNDIFERKPLAQSLINLATNIEDSFTVVLDAKWGSGKTTFLRQFQRLAASSGVPTIYMDAFKADISGDAFSAVAAAILEKLDTTKGKVDKIRAGLLSAASKTAILLAQGTVRAAVAYGTAGIVSANGVGQIVKSDKVADAVASGATSIAEKSEKLISESLEKQSKVQQTVELLSSALAETCNYLVEKANDTEGKNPHKKVYFIVDELDRCRPNFAVELLEVIKHFFDTEQVVFLLAADCDQLFSSIRHAYGLNLDAERYFEKFYDLKFTFREHTDHQGSTIKRYSKHIADQLPSDEEDGRYVDTCFDLLVEFCEHYQLGLRTFQKICQKYILVLAQTNANHLRLAPGIMVLCFLSIADPKLYAAIRDQQLSYTEFSEKFTLVSSNKDVLNDINWFLSFMQFALVQDDSDLSPQAAGWREAMFRQSLNRRKVLSTMARKYIETFSTPEK